jgi:hypothetical protein
MWDALSAAKGRGHHLAFARRVWQLARERIANEEGGLPRLYRYVERDLSLSSGLRTRRGVRETFAPSLSRLSLEYRPLDMGHQQQLEPMKLNIGGLEIKKYIEPLPDPSREGSGND